MHMVTDVLIALVALLHVYFFLLETVLFKTRGRRVFGLSAEKAEIMAPAMSNQGCYNGFLVAALVIGLLHPDPHVAFLFKIYGLSCVIVAGIWGGITVKRTILYIQALPALVALILVHLR
jgi:putative membrane protein